MTKPLKKQAQNAVRPQIANLMRGTVDAAGRLSIDTVRLSIETASTPTPHLSGQPFPPQGDTGGAIPRRHSLPLCVTPFGLSGQLAGVE